MKFDIESIGGQDPIKVKRVLFEYKGTMLYPRLFDLSDLTEEFNSEKVGLELINMGFIDKPKGHDKYVITSACLSFLNSSDKSFTRIEAQKNLDIVLNKIDTLNNILPTIYKMPLVILFGSFLDDSKDPVGDVDLVITTPFNKDLMKKGQKNNYRKAVEFMVNDYLDQHPDYSGAPLDILDIWLTDYLTFPESISLHPLVDFHSMLLKHKMPFKILRGDKKVMLQQLIEIAGVWSERHPDMNEPMRRRLTTIKESYGFFESMIYSMPDFAIDELYTNLFEGKKGKMGC